MKIHYRIIYLLISVFFIYTLLFCGFIYYSISSYSFQDFYKRLEIRAATTAKIESEKPKDVSVIKEMRQEFLEKLPEQEEYVYKINPENNGLTVPKGEDGLPDELVADIIEFGNGNFQEKSKFYSGIKFKTLNGDSFIAVVSAQNYFYTHHIAYLQNLLITSLLYGLLLIVFVSLLISRTLVRPVQNIIKEVKKISFENLHLRLKLPKSKDSLRKLALTFNDMLNRLETTVETQKNFISNASHELNTPLTSIIGEADLALSKDREKEEYQKALANILSEAEKLEKKTKALLLLAQTGFDGKSQKFDILRTDQLILDVKETVQRINFNCKIYLDFSLLPENPMKLKVNGNFYLLHLALSNIVLNACKYSNDSPVHVALGASDKEIIIVVRDSGIGIPEGEMQYIYDPYFRASNTGDFKGYGIGLPLARNIIRIHKGKLEVNSIEGQGTSVQINLPIAIIKL
ncbi:HAMP domain-containing sensor histidine kinase [Aequorivita echinoideorum]|uniref:histidine kinase n=1 Tax=Aequorivita echinoideorum TaxID=1549647 RepID=A0ABS5S0S2_9FLAO|nr:HAMP domain-containing sensor histidine kinase [Aequorivita echinoideorum]MBT0606817.1 HAMP domain-containing histidine kinase [Aequorivita echinoideorum]